MPDGTAPDSPPVPNRLQVGDWTVEPALNQLAGAGRTVKLEPKAMAVLVYLADRPGQVVSRDALLAAVWADVTVGDDSLTQVVLKLRKVLGNTPPYIQTISKGGYRLVAPVVRSAEIDLPPVRPDNGSSYAGRKGYARWMATAGIATTILLAAIAFWWIERGPAIGVAPERAPAAGVVTPGTAHPSVTIRPFEPLSDDPQEMLLARGLTADLVTDLSKVFGLSIIGLAADTEAGGEPPSPVARPHYVVSGSVQRVGDRLRLHVHLTDARTGNQLWSERFDRALSGFFAIQEELGPKLLNLLPGKVSEAELRRVAQRHTRNLEAYEYYQRGQWALHVRQKAENELAREMFRRAIMLDANFARAYSGLARTYAADYRHRWSGDGTASLDRAFEMARTAHQVNPDIPETYWVLAYIHAERRQHEQAVRYLEAAVRLYPSFADGYALMGSIHTHTGRPAEGVRLVRRAMRLNPEGGHLYFLTLGRAYLFLGDLEQARMNLEHALSRNTVHLETHVYMAALYVSAGEQAAAAWEAEEIRALQPGFSSRRWLETYPMTDDMQKTTLVKALHELGF